MNTADHHTQRGGAADSASYHRVLSHHHQRLSCWCRSHSDRRLTWTAELQTMLGVTASVMLAALRFSCHRLFSASPLSRIACSTRSTPSGRSVRHCSDAGRCVHHQPPPPPYKHYFKGETSAAGRLGLLTAQRWILQRQTSGKELLLQKTGLHCPYMHFLLLQAKRWPFRVSVYCMLKLLTSLEPTVAAPQAFSAWNRSASMATQLQHRTPTDQRRTESIGLLCSNSAVWLLCLCNGRLTEGQ